jgi:diguanylate cyclase (GGDEF)-like protein
MGNFSLDIPTVLFCLLLSHLAIAATLTIYLIQSVSRHTSDIRFLVSRLLQGTGVFLASQRGQIPVIYSLNWGNTLIFLGLALELRTLVTLNKHNRRLDIFSAMIFGLFIIVFWGVEKDLNQSVVIASAFLSLLYLSSAILMILYNSEKSILRYILSLTCSVSGGLMAIRAMSASNQPNFTLLSKNRIQDTTFIVVFLFQIISGISYLLLLRDRNEHLLKAANQKLSLLAMNDSLTGLANRRSFNEYLKRGISECRLSADPLGLIMIDIDFFKKYNDLYGHKGGDECLIDVARELARCCRRSTDMVARYGGEEFAIILLNTSAAEALHIAELVRKGVNHLAIPHAASEVSEHVTLSLGVFSAVPTSDEHNSAWYIIEADQRLYNAKHAGRNRCVCN